MSKNKLKAQIKALPKGFKKKVTTILCTSAQKQKFKLGSKFRGLNVITSDFVPDNIYYLCDEEFVSKLEKEVKLKLEDNKLRIN